MILTTTPRSVARHIILLIALIASPVLDALTSDKQQVIEIQADGAEIDEKSGISTYYGNVQITQGTMIISADRIRIKTDRSTVVQITASMNQGTFDLAHYEQLPGENKKPVLADAREINYLIQEEKLHLSGQAQLVQQPNKFEGELLYYDMKQGKVKMHGSNNADEGSGRINMTLTPKKD